MFNSTTHFYKSDEWERFRLTVINDRKTDQGLIICEYCGEVILKPYDLILHHINPITNENVNDYNISLNPENIMIVHHGCHNEIHERFGFGSGSRHIYLVYGAPCSGKSSFVSRIAGRHDIIVDMDSIFECITANDRYDKPDSIKSVAFGVRDSLLDSIKVRRGRWTNAYIIGGYPMASERERMSSIYGCEEIFIDVSKEECLLRCDGRPKEWRDYVEAWFERYTETKRGYE